MFQDNKTASPIGPGQNQKEDGVHRISPSFFMGYRPSHVSHRFWCRIELQHFFATVLQQNTPKNPFCNRFATGKQSYIPTYYHLLNLSKA